MSTRAMAEQYDSHGKRVRDATLTLNRSRTSYGIPTGNYSLFINYGSRMMALSIPVQEWENLTRQEAE